jgi:hypothetical protein
VLDATDSCRDQRLESDTVADCIATRVQTGTGNVKQAADRREAGRIGRRENLRRVEA